MKSFPVVTDQFFVSIPCRMALSIRKLALLNFLGYIMLELLIGFAVTAVVGRYIFKGYSPTGVLMVGGVLLLAVAAWLGQPVLPDKVEATGLVLTDIVEFIKHLLSNRSADLGLMIMVLCGFAACMTHIGANDMVVKLAARPLGAIKSPYVLMVAAYFVACVMSLAVSSATGLGVLLMATLFPLMVNMGISRGAAAAICASPVAVILSPTSGDVVIAAEASGVDLVDFAFKTTLPISIAAIVAMGVAHFFWQRWLDRKEGVVPTRQDVNEIHTTAPRFYALLPFTPIFGVLLFNGDYAPKLHIVTILVICLMLTAVIEFIRYRDARQVYAGLDVAYKGMGEAFTSVVMLIVAAGVFAQGLSQVGFISHLIALAQSFGTGAVVLMVVLVVITTLAAITTGSGNAPFYAFVELIPKLAVHSGINPAFLAIPMLQASNLGRTVSPVAGVVVACAGMGKISPFEIVKRTSVPVAVGLVVVLMGTVVLVPM
ncbi:anaerobic C4-dicarboxylate transporter DcuC [Laribacter hongkongensis]|uniref:anaerobic C4-dicarboxylate transporter DcuC n=1 Tax=Laribacter hongkongensis TaxID=168471 RepID=UPI001EFC86EF|nr:anaerobic C4-dicarboxylate transporter DcuC [Laribacter hongkongensis]MCG9057172.1 anaerobic C4-dicarboxylate transporter DcuC [Laribacter hongkongensis]